MDDRLFTLPLELIQEYQTNDPFKIAKRMTVYQKKSIRISVRFIDTVKQKGFCTNILNNYYIFITRI